MENCQHENQTLEEVITHRTTSPLEDDTVEKAWVCMDCEEVQEREE